MSSKLDATNQKITARQKKSVWKSVNLYYQDPIALKNGEGSIVWDEDGNRYIDFFGGILTTSIGHAHPKFVNRLHEQLGKIVHMSPLYPHRNQAELAEKIVELTPDGLDSVYFTNSGTEANEMAVLLAKEYTENVDFFALHHAYSGSSMLAKSMTAINTWRFQSNQAPGIKYTSNAYCYRCPFKLKPESCGTVCAQTFEENIKTTSTGKIAGILCEPIQGVGGFITPPPDFFKIIYDICKQYGGLFVADEVQGGTKRVADDWFSITGWGVKPDIVTMAKGIANGIPMGVVAAKKEHTDKLAGKGMLLNTFGGNPISTVAALTTIEILEEEAKKEDLQRKSKFMNERLEQMFAKYSLIGDLRGKGFMRAVELVENRETKEPAVQEIAHLFEITRKKGLLIGKGGLYGNVVRLAPPMNISDELIEQAMDIFDESLAEVQKTL